MQEARYHGADLCQVQGMRIVPRTAPAMHAWRCMQLGGSASIAGSGRCIMGLLPRMHACRVMLVMQREACTALNQHAGQCMQFNVAYARYTYGACMVLPLLGNAHAWHCPCMVLSLQVAAIGTMSENLHRLLKQSMRGLLSVHGLRMDSSGCSCTLRMSFLNGLPSAALASLSWSLRSELPAEPIMLLLPPLSACVSARRRSCIHVLC